MSILVYFLFCCISGDLRYLPLLTHSFPTRLSADLFLPGLILTRRLTRATRSLGGSCARHWIAARTISDSLVRRPLVVTAISIILSWRSSVWVMLTVFLFVSGFDV